MAGLRPCSRPGCPTLVAGGGLCPAHARAYEQHRGSRQARGYGQHWERFRERFMQELIAEGIPVICGAALPCGPPVDVSRCRQAGIFNPRHLHLDHYPPLEDHERADRRAVCDRARVRFLCRSCHSAVTLEQQRQHLGR